MGEGLGACQLSRAVYKNIKAQADTDVQAHNWSTSRPPGYKDLIEVGELPPGYCFLGHVLLYAVFARYLLPRNCGTGETRIQQRYVYF